MYYLNKLNEIEMHFLIKLVIKALVVSFVFKSVSVKTCDQFNFVDNELTPQEVSRFTQFRHFHRPITFAIPYYFLAKILAKKHNVSNVKTKSWHDPNVIKYFSSKPATNDPNDNKATILGFTGLFFYTTRITHYFNGKDSSRFQVNLLLLR